MTESTTRSSLISSPKHQPVRSLPPYGRDIPQALQDLSQLLPDAPATEDDGQPSQVENPEVQDPAQVQVDHHQQEALSDDSPVIIAPSGYTRTGCQVC